MKSFSDQTDYSYGDTSATVRSFLEREANKINYMYAQHFKNTMEPLNIPDISKDKRFPWMVSNPILDLKPESCYPIRPVLTAAFQLKDLPRNQLLGVICALSDPMKENEIA